jgi:cytochrome P450
MPAPAAYPLGAEVTVSDLERDPHPTLAGLRRREPVSWLPALGGWLVTRHELALRVLRDPQGFTVQDERFSTAQVVGPSMLSLDGREHERHRTPFAAPFRPGAVRERFAATVAEECDRILDGLVSAGQCELRGDFAGPLAAGVLTRALGLDGAEADAVRGWYELIVAAVTELTAGGALPRAGALAYQALAARLAEVIDDGARTAGGGRPSQLAGGATTTGGARGSLLAGGARTAGGVQHSLLNAAADAARGALSPAELISNAAVLLFGGIETTEAMIANAVALMLRAPEVLARLRAEPGAPPDPRTLDAVLDESLRLEPAAAMLDRYATADVELGGSTIRAGDLVRVSVAAAGRDPAVFDNPDRLLVDPPRPRRHLAFAQGPHVCIGVHLARLEARAALARALERLPGLRLDPARPAEIRGLVFRKPPELWVRWD